MGEWSEVSEVGMGARMCKDLGCPHHADQVGIPGGHELVNKVVHYTPF